MKEQGKTGIKGEEKRRSDQRGRRLGWDENEERTEGNAGGDENEERTESNAGRDGNERREQKVIRRGKGMERREENNRKW